MQSSADKQIGTHYEVHALRNGRWLIDCAAKEPEQAIREAKDILRDAEVRGARVVKEIWNPSTNTTAARIIFSKLKSDSAPMPRSGVKARSANQKPPGPVAAAPSRPGTTPRAPSAAKTKLAADQFTAFAFLSLAAAGVASGGVVWLILS